MADSLLDFGKIASTAINLGQLEETARRNDILEQNSLLEMGRLQNSRETLKLQQQKLKFDSVTRGFDELQKLAESPQFAVNPAAQVDIRYTQANLLKYGLGVNIDVPSREEMVGSMEEFGGFIKAIRGGTPEERRAATERLFTAAPGFALKTMKELKEANELDAQGEQLHLKIEMDKSRLESMNVRTGRLKLQQGVFTEHLGALNQSVHLADAPDLNSAFKTVMSFEKPEARQAFLNLNPDFKEKFTGMTAKRRYAMVSTLQQMRDVLEEKEAVLVDQQQLTGHAPIALEEEVKSLRTILKAREAEGIYLDDPFNKEKYKTLKKEEQNVRLAYGAVEQKLKDVNEERLQWQQSKFADLQKEKLATEFAQEKFLEHLREGMDDNQAGLEAIKDTKKQYPGVAMDTGKLKNLNKVGKQDIGIHLGQEDVSRNLKVIESAQGVVDYAHDLMERIDKNPAIVGRGAQLGTALAGSGQQLRAIVGMDPVGAKFLNTKTRDEAEAFYEVLVYLQARAMDPSGPLDLKVVQHAREVLGDFNSLTTGPGQLRNKLGTVTQNAERNIRTARRRLRGGMDAYLTDDTKAVGQMSEEELLKSIINGLQ